MDGIFKTKCKEVFLMGHFYKKGLWSLLTNVEGRGGSGSAWDVFVKVSGKKFGQKFDEITKIL